MNKKFYFKILIGLLTILIIYLSFITFFHNDKIKISTYITEKDKHIVESIKVLYIGNENMQLMNTFLKHHIPIKFQLDINNEIEENVIIIDGNSIQNINYENLKDMIRQNKSIFFHNITSTKVLSEKVLNEKSYDVLTSTDQNLKQLVKVYIDENGKFKLLTIGYYSSHGKEYEDLFEKINQYKNNNSN